MKKVYAVLIIPNFSFVLKVTHIEKSNLKCCYSFKANIVKHEAALEKINEAYTSITQYKREVSNLVPRHQEAQAAVKDHVNFVEIQREEYIQVQYK